MIVVNGVLYHSEEIKDDSYIVVDGVLMHHGVVGMKWGRRKALYDRYRLSSKAQKNLKFNFDQHGKNTNRTLRQDLKLAKRNAKQRALTGFGLTALSGLAAGKAIEKGHYDLAALGVAGEVAGLVRGIRGSADMAKISRIQNNPRIIKRAKK